MKKKIILLASSLVLLNAVPIAAKEDNSKRISEIEAQIKELKAELKELKGSESDEVVIVDDENFYAVFKEIKEKKDFKGRPMYEFVFEVENKTDKELVVQAASVAIDGTMVDTSFLTMSQEVGPKKKAKAVMNMQSYTDDELPELTGDLEMALRVFSWDDLNAQNEYPFKANLEDYLQ